MRSIVCMCMYHVVSTVNNFNWIHLLVSMTRNYIMEEEFQYTLCTHTYTRYFIYKIHL